MQTRHGWYVLPFDLAIDPAKSADLRVRINRAALKNSGLAVSAKLYDMAEVIE